MENFSNEFIKACVDELGIQNLDEDCLKFITDDLSFKTSLLLYQAVKLMRCCKRKRLIPTDVEGAMKLYNVQPTYGFKGKDWIPFRRSGTTSAGRDLVISDDKDIDLDDFIAQDVPKLPPNVYIKAHWLSIDGVQPRIPENPKTTEDGDVVSYTLPGRVIQEAKNNAFQDITVEQQVYFKEATEACVCADEKIRKEALSSLSADPGLQPLVPRFVAFLSEGVKLNVAQQNYVQLIYLMRMMRSLVENPHLSVDSYIHELLPAAASCCMSKQLCQRPKEDNHWALRTFAARQLSYLVRKYTTETNLIHSRIVKLALRVMQDQSSALVSCFGAISIIGELGEEVVRSALIPYIRTFGERVRQAEEIAHQQNPLEHLTVKKITEQLTSVVCPAVKHVMQPPDHMSDYQARFGPYFAQYILAGVVKERQTHPSPYQKQQNAQQRRLSAPSQKVVMIPAKSEPTTPQLYHPQLGHSTSIPSRSPGPATPGAAFMASAARFQTVPPRAASPATSSAHVTVRVVGQQQQQPQQGQK